MDAFVLNWFGVVALVSLFFALTMLFLRLKRNSVSMTMRILSVLLIFSSLYVLFSGGVDLTKVNYSNLDSNKKIFNVKRNSRSFSQQFTIIVPEVQNKLQLGYDVGGQSLGDGTGIDVNELAELLDRIVKDALERDSALTKWPKRLEGFCVGLLSSIALLLLTSLVHLPSNRTNSTS